MPVAYGIERGARAEDELPRVVGAGDDVAADVVGVVRLHLRDAADVPREDPVAEARGEALDLRLDPRPWRRRCSRRARARRRRAGGRRRSSGSGRRGTAGRRARTGCSGIRPLATSFSAAAISRVAAADVDGAGAARLLVRPRHAALDREVDLERPGAVPVARQRARDRAAACGRRRSARRPPARRRASRCRAPSSSSSESTRTPVSNLAP